MEKSGLVGFPVPLAPLVQFRLSNAAKDCPAAACRAERVSSQSIPYEVVSQETRKGLTMSRGKMYSGESDGLQDHSRPEALHPDQAGAVRQDRARGPHRTSSSCLTAPQISCQFALVATDKIYLPYLRQCIVYLKERLEDAARLSFSISTSSPARAIL